MSATTVKEAGPWISVALYTAGSVALGGGIALVGQIFNLSEQWLSAILLWAVGAVFAWAVLRHWTLAALAAILIPVDAQYCG